MLVALMMMLIALDNGYQARPMTPILNPRRAASADAIRDFSAGHGHPGWNSSPASSRARNGRRYSTDLPPAISRYSIGTHAVIEDPVAFHRLGVAVMHEQHRFGVAQRAKLWAKSENPPCAGDDRHPYPRTLAMTIYGDLDVSVIDELPPGRKPIQTLHKFDNQLTSLYQSIRQQINLGRQVYIVFPLIKEEAKR